ncbi:MAG: tRNA (guanosine(37)-N1)-methyltransferase TrmD [Planctomycetota bacterium]|nr:tRNA (guanosine(37)-N1)-methyltransferase TrmD [Planctomycetota bacterium]
MRFDILSLFPEMFPGVLNASILGRAATGGFASYHLHDIRDFADNKHAKVDDRPFGGGPGMVMMCQPLHDCVLAVEGQDETPATRILLTPQGERLDQRRVEDLATRSRLLIIAGHYEGVDERVIDELAPLELSVGDYVLSGGELPAMTLIDSIVRLLPGVLGHEDSAAEDSYSVRASAPDSGGEGRRLLDCPHFTRPRIWKDRAVPDVLLSGDHGAVDEWRLEQMVERTRLRRPELLENRDP